MDHPIIDQHHIPFGDVIDEAVIVDIDGIEFLAAGAPDSELHDIADLEIELGAEISGTNRWSLGVEENADLGVEFGGNGAD